MAPGDNNCGCCLDVQTLEEDTFWGINVYQVHDLNSFHYFTTTCEPVQNLGDVNCIENRLEDANHYFVYHVLVMEFPWPVDSMKVWGLQSCST